LPKAGSLTRTFDLSLQTSGASSEHAIMEVYGCEADHKSQALSRKEIKLRRIWTITRTTFTVPAACDQFGIRFYVPRAITEMWLDDVRLTPAIKRQP
jgi:hypothetical protein